MRNLFVIPAVALMALGFSACSSDEPVQDGQLPDGTPVTVNFTAGLEGAQQSRSFGDGTTAKLLTYAVYDAATGNLLVNSRDEAAKTFDASLSTTVDLHLVTGKTYDIVFWADAYAGDTGTPYAFDAAAHTITVSYGTLANDEKRDAFFASTQLKVTGDMQESITLYRPFAQINVGTNDLAIAQAAGIGGVQAEMTATSEQLFGVLDLKDGSVSGTAVSPAFLKAAIPDASEAFPVSGYDYLLMSYVLLGKTDRINADIELTFYGNDGAAEYNTISVPAVPLERNFRTNIYGSLLTSTVDFTVDIAPGFTGSEDVEYVNEKKAVTHIDATTGAVVCDVPVLPDGYTEATMPTVGVSVDPDGNVLEMNNYTNFKAAMAAGGTIYMNKNAEFHTTQAHTPVSAEGVTIYGNGATFFDNEKDMGLERSAYPDDAVVNITIYDTNNLRVWGGRKTNAVVNIVYENCTMTGTNMLTDGTSSFTMLKESATNIEGETNITIKNCSMKNAQVGLYSMFNGKIEVINTKFENVSIPLNINHKADGNCDVIVDGCEFINCGNEYKEAGSTVWDYAAPIRVVDNHVADAATTATTTLKVSGCTFTGTRGVCDVLLRDYRSGKKSRPLTSTDNQAGLRVVDEEPDSSVGTEVFNPAR